MKILKPHFWYNKSQRNGVFFLLLLVVVLQVIYSFVDFPHANEGFSNHKIADLQLKIDALKKVEIEKRKPKIYPFNPNYLTDYKGSQIGMSIQEIDRLLDYRKKQQFVNSVADFQKVTKISDSLLSEISPYFKFPDWVVRQQQKKNFIKNKVDVSIVKLTTTDLNLATVNDLQTIHGVNEYVAERILKYRNRIQGFTFNRQLSEVWKLDTIVAENILSVFVIKVKPIIKKININTATFKQVLSNPYIDYDLCKKIFDFRDEVAELQSIEELKKIIENKDYIKYKYSSIL